MSQVSQTNCGTDGRTDSRAQEPVANSTSGAGEPGEWNEAAILTTIAELLSDRVNAPAQSAFGPDQELRSLAIDSIDLALVFSHFEQESGLEFANEDIGLERYQTLRAVALAIREKLGVQRARD